jgi:hypothetical protein
MGRYFQWWLLGANRVTSMLDRGSNKFVHRVEEWLLIKEIMVNSGNR